MYVASEAYQDEPSRFLSTMKTYRTSGGQFNLLIEKSIKFYILQARFACLRCAACGHYVSAESPCGRLKLLNLTYFGNFLLYMHIVNKSIRLIYHFYLKI